MGYTFLMVDLPGEFVRLRDDYERMIRENRLDRSLSEAFFDASEPFSFHLNIAGMGFCRERMRSLDMLAEGEAGPFPAYPSWDPLHYGSVVEYRLGNPEIWAEYEAAEQSAMTQRGSGPGIADFKLSSNGPWIVSGDEVGSALAHYEQLSSDRRVELEEREVWREWIEWLRRAAAGFEVG